MRTNRVCGLQKEYCVMAENTNTPDYIVISSFLLTRTFETTWKILFSLALAHFWGTTSLYPFQTSLPVLAALTHLRKDHCNLETHYWISPHAVTTKGCGPSVFLYFSFHSNWIRRDCNKMTTDNISSVHWMGKGKMIPCPTG